ncbi:MAG: glycosyltransferase family 4 protein, partial [bacterium]
MPKRILLLTHEFPPGRGGIGTYTHELARAAHIAGHTVTVFAPSYRQNLRDEDRRRYPFRVIRFRAERYRRRDFPLLLSRAIWAVRHRDVDILHATQWPFVMALAFLSRFRPVCFLATVHGTECLSVKQSRAARLLRVTDMYGAAERIVANSEFTKRFLLQEYRAIPEDRVKTTLLGVNPFWFEDPNREAVAAVRVRFGIPNDRRIILTVARLTERKGQHVVLEALPRLSTSLRRCVTYVMVGKRRDEGYLARLRQLAAKCDTQVVFAGAVSDEDLRAFYAMSSIFCMPGVPHPSEVEGFGLAYLEAAASGVPSIATEVGGVPEVVLDGETGLLTESQNPQAVASALESLLS